VVGELVGEFDGNVVGVVVGELVGEVVGVVVGEEVEGLEDTLGFPEIDGVEEGTREGNPVGDSVVQGPMSLQALSLDPGSSSSQSSSSRQTYSWSIHWTASPRSYSSPGIHSSGHSPSREKGHGPRGSQNSSSSESLDDLDCGLATSLSKSEAPPGTFDASWHFLRFRQ